MFQFLTLSRKPERSGFTLIELLVVIAIIGILASIVLASLNTARTRAADARVKSQLTTLRVSAELYFDTNSHYSPAGAANDCTGGMFADSDSKMSTYTAAANYPANTTIVCRHNAGTAASGVKATAYAVSANLQAVADASGVGLDNWCVDSTGASKGIVAPLGTSATAC